MYIYIYIPYITYIYIYILYIYHIPSYSLPSTHRYLQNPKKSSVDAPSLAGVEALAPTERCHWAIGFSWIGPGVSQRPKTEFICQESWEILQFFESYEPKDTMRDHLNGPHRTPMDGHLSRIKRSQILAVTEIID